MQALVLAAITYIVTPPPTAYFQQICNIEAALTEARTQLADPAVATTHSRTIVQYPEIFRSANGSTYTKTRRDYTHRDIPVALINRFTCEIVVTKIEKKASAQSAVLANVDPRFSFAIEDRLYGRVWNSYNTPLEVGDSSWVVIGIKWEVLDSKTTLIYIPYSRALHTHFPELALAGQEHYVRDLHEALDELRSLGVRSHAFPSELLADVAEKHFLAGLKLVPLIEQTDPIEFYAYRDSTLLFNPFQRVMVILGANGDHAFNAVVSRASAEGLMQIWPPTCNLIRGLYPDAKIAPRCTSESPSITLPCLLASRCQNRTHHESIKTAIALFDNNLKIFADAFGSAAQANPDIQGWLFGAYNGGAGRVIGAIRAHGARWRQYHKRNSLRPETLSYLDQFDYLIENPDKAYGSQSQK